MTRGEGRNRSEIEDLNSSIQVLDHELSTLETELNKSTQGDSQAAVLTTLQRAFLFTLEAYASTILQRLRAELFERRYEMPKSDAEVFSILQKNGALDLVQARKLRQFCEARHLSSRDLSKLDFEGILQAYVAERDEVRQIIRLS